MNELVNHPLASLILFLTACWLMKKVFVDD